MTRSDHVFGQDLVRAGERRTILVVIITSLMMIVEIIAGLLFGSMALLADGLHMASHAAALSVSVAAYVLARRYARDARFSFGTGKLNSLAAFTSAIMLVMFAVLMVVESVRRFLFPVDIAFNQAIAVAVLGLIVNAASMFILGGHHERRHDHTHEHRHDHSLRAAYLHVLADALTSLLAIFALLAAKYLGAQFMDPLMGIVGAVLVSRWSWHLINDSARILLDRQAPARTLDEIRISLEADGQTTISDLHVWSIGPYIFAAEICLQNPAGNPPEYYRDLLPSDLGLVHVIIETRSLNT